MHYRYLLQIPVGCSFETTKDPLELLILFKTF